MNLIDTHTHIDLEEFNDETDLIIERATKNCVTRIINIGATKGLQGAINSIELAKKYDNLFCSVGIHPNDAYLNLDFEQIEKFAHNEKVCAIGETGLDFFRDRSSKEDQYKLFEQHINLAIQTKKPLVIHSRETANECLEILEKYSSSNITGVFHCFNYDLDTYKRIIDLGFLISLTGIVTFKNALKLQELVKSISLDSFMLETDAPYMAPTPHRGTRNEPSYVLDIAKKISELKDVSLEMVAKTTTKTAENLFNLKPLP